VTFKRALLNAFFTDYIFGKEGLNPTEGFNRPISRNFTLNAK